MNPWDLFTWICAVVLGVSTIIIFAYFVRDARRFIAEERERGEGRAKSDH